MPWKPKNNIEITPTSTHDIKRIELYYIHDYFEKKNDSVNISQVTNVETLKSGMAQPISIATVPPPIITLSKTLSLYQSSAPWSNTIIAISLSRLSLTLVVVI